MVIFAAGFGVNILNVHVYLQNRNETVKLERQLNLANLLLDIVDEIAMIFPKNKWKPKKFLNCEREKMLSSKIGKSAVLESKHRW